MAKTNDYLAQIVEQFSITVDQLLAANGGVPEPFTLTPGAPIVIPPH